MPTYVHGTATLGAYPELEQALFTCVDTVKEEARDQKACRVSFLGLKPERLGKAISSIDEIVNKVNFTFCICVPYCF